MADKIGQTCHVHAQGFGEVWSGVLNGHIEVAVKKIFNSTELDTSQDSEIRCVVPKPWLVEHAIALYRQSPNVASTPALCHSCLRMFSVASKDFYREQGTRSLSCFLDGESQVVFSFLYMPKSLKVVCSLLLRSGQMDDGNLFLVLVSVSRVRAIPVATNQQQVHVFTCFVCCRNS